MFSNFSESSLDVLIRCYVDLADWYDWMKEKEAVQLAIMRIVAEMELSIAFPTRSIYVEEVPKNLQNQGRIIGDPTNSAQKP